MLRLLRSQVPIRCLSTTRRVGQVVLKDASRPMTVNQTLPDPMKDRNKRILTFLAFAVGTGAAMAVIFNYEKTESAIVSNTMFYLRRSQQTKELLGENIEFAGVVPWVWGTLNPVAGKINITFRVKGKKGVEGTVKLLADRENRRDEFLIREWSLTSGDNKINLMAENPQCFFE
ncbi:Cytochrome c oxidase assembly factor 1 [Nakaseomyces bracarensis]|uniref:Cytochrome c oxidase assembly factor 1 n=1 Tax=Nakaseomyces bracarensis TaxID=273131 RepID=A0ABR4NUZ7_9SACH